MESVRQLYQYDSDILRHGEEHLTQILRLNLYLVRGHLELCQLRNSIHKESNLLGELRCYLLRCHDCILNDIVKYSSHYRLLVKLELCQDYGHIQRVHDIRLPGLSELSLVGSVRHLICLLYHSDVGRWVICEYP